ncbi:ATP-binding protein [Pectobacterium brasiliense]|uniref:AAA family ATPase n=1 Tax=Pectobacterium brasiliense TaxID=180957 RepID=UPI00094A7FB0|nr:ATP-binding protein [Pectobacterium brasiliense]APS29997.1 hypothetical protein NC16_09815 [Pectobacterium brasiliense]MBN3098165.1 ATP-binding protein [Pectobacterium brasiliense]MBN3102909.1 ATP-binding protein [Pectobacterium brasiliense]MBN3164755.1 ATP-binding protein [Pectobacterium brasiliense]
MSKDSHKSSKKNATSLRELFLDPNNYRFVDNENYRVVPEGNITDFSIQKRTRHFIEGNRQENIRDLLSSFKSNGFLDVDIIQARELDDGAFLVLEGNRRVTALKCLQEDFEKGLYIGNLDPHVFSNVKFELHETSDIEKHLIVMGLKHISGNKKWSTFNQSKLVHDFLFPYRGKDNYFNKESELCESLGISKARLRSMIRIYNLISAYKKSDYSEQFDPSRYGLFEEIIKKPAIREWLGWSDENYDAKNKINLERLFSWISRGDEFCSDEDINDEMSEDDVFENKNDYEEREPIITKSLEIRELALFINNESALEVMERERSLARGLAVSGTIDKQNYQNALGSLQSSVKTLVEIRNHVSNEDVELLSDAKEKLVSILPKKSNLNIEGGNFNVAFEFGRPVQFSEINISKYKSFKSFKLENLNKINIIAGFNNSGKTSLLEAIYLLTQQNDISSFFNLVKSKNKSIDLSPVLLNKIFTKDISINGVYNNVSVGVEYKKFEAIDIDKKDDYIASYSVSSSVDGQEFSTVIHTFVHEQMIRNNNSILKLCPASIESPYFYSLEGLIKNYTKSVETKCRSNDGDEFVTALSLVVEFLRNIDSTILDVRFTEENELKRFIVESEKSKFSNFDITTYGEGLQRIFYIALSFAASKNGVLLIDEFETAIHYSLLIKFTYFVQKLSENFNVQVFITTHSQECIAAFLNNSGNNKIISGIQLNNKDDEITYKEVDGERLQYLIESLGVDIRGVGDE